MIVLSCGRHEIREPGWELTLWWRLGGDPTLKREAYGFRIARRRNLLFTDREVMRFVPLWRGYRLVFCGWRRKEYGRTPQQQERN